MNLFSRLRLKPMMQWREPNAYVRKNISHGRWLGLWLVLMIPTSMLLTSSTFRRGGTSRAAVTFLTAAFAIFAVLGVIRAWLSSGDVVWLMQDEIAKGTRNTIRTRYKNIDCCEVSQASYRDTRFAILRFKLKKGLQIGEADEIVVPDSIDLQLVLRILGDKGVKIKTV
jgi:hypothetical protein